MRDLRPLLNLSPDRLYALPLLVLYPTNSCDSRRLSCDIRRAPRRNMLPALALRSAEESALSVQHVLFSSGEVPQHPHWTQIGQAFRARSAHRLADQRHSARKAGSADRRTDRSAHLELGCCHA